MFNLIKRSTPFIHLNGVKSHYIGAIYRISSTSVQRCTFDISLSDIYLYSPVFLNVFRKNHINIKQDLLKRKFTYDHV